MAQQLVLLSSGETLSLVGQTDAGVQTDAGTHEWKACEAIMTWHAKAGRWVSTPIDNDKN